MASSDENLNLTIRAKDEATSTLKKVKESVDGVTSATDKTKKSNEDLTASVFKGVAAWDIFKRGVQEAKQFMSESVDEYLDAQKKLDLTRATVESMGQSFEAARPQLEAFGDRMAHLGHDGETASLAAAQLAKLAGGDLAKGMQLAKLAADLTASGYNDFAGNVDNLTKVLAGKGQRALIDYRVNMDENATTAEQLNAIQGKVTQTTEDYANTIPGKLLIVKQGYSDLKEEIGRGFVTAITSAMTANDAFGASMGGMTSVTREAGPVIFSLTSLAMALGESFVLVGKVIAFDITALTNFKKALKGDEQAKATIAASAEQVSATFNALKDSIHNAVNPVEEYHKAMDASDAAMAKTKKSQEEQIKSLFKVANANTSAGTSADSLTAKYKNLDDAFIKVSQTATDELASLKKAHDDNVTSARENIENLKKSLRDLSDSYQKSAADAQKAFDAQKKNDRMSVAATIVAQREKMKALQKQADTEKDPNKKIGIVEALEKERAAYAETAQLREDLAAEIQATEQRNSETELQRAVDDYVEKRKQAEIEFADARADAAKEYKAKQAEIKLQLKQAQQKLDDENATYKAKRKEIDTFLKQAEEQRYSVAKSTSTKIIAELDKEIAKYNQLAEAISRASQGKPAQVVSSHSASGHEHGGYVQGPRGVAVPIIAHGQERIIPAGQSSGQGGGSTINIIINNPVVRSDSDKAQLKEDIDQALRDVTRVHKLKVI